MYAQCALCGNGGRGSTLPAPAMLRAWGEIAGLARAAHESSAHNAAPRQSRPTAVGQQRPRQSLLSSARTGNTQLTYIYTSGLTLEIVDFETNLSITHNQKYVH